MISCTEFIPLYSEFFNFLENRGGHNAVMDYWIHISDTSIGDKTNPNSLAYNCEKFGGYKGAVAYWGHTLTEEACDLFQLNDNKNHIKYEHIRRCPSRGMLNSLKHIEPYYDYCSHCDILYSRVLKNYGIEYLRDKSNVDKAECRSILFEKGCMPDIDWKHITDEEAKALKKDDTVEIIDIKADDNNYFHPDFHLLGDNALKYCADTFGEEAVIEFLTTYVKNYYSPQIKDIKSRGLIAIKEWIESVYKKEQSSHLLNCTLTENELTVTISKSPVIEYMHSLNQQPSPYYIEETRTLYQVVADECRLAFQLHYYKEDGATSFTFKKTNNEQ